MKEPEEDVWGDMPELVDQIEMPGLACMSDNSSRSERSSESKQCLLGVFLDSLNI